MRVWVTRAEPGASATAARLTALGHAPLVAPLLTIQPLPFPPMPDRVGALAFTSGNGVAALAGRPELERLRRLPVFAVGDATAEAARSLGFGQVTSAAGDVAALGALIQARRAELSGPVLHFAALQRAGDLQAIGAAVTVVPVYQAAELPTPEAAVSAWAELDAVLVHSPRGARALATAIGGRDLSRMTAVCISRAAVEPLPAQGWRAMKVAEAPNEAALLARLGKAARPS